MEETGEVKLVCEGVSGKVNFETHTLILPTLSIGNVGQISIDLLLNTFKFNRIGYLECPYVSAAVGNSAIQGQSDSTIFTSLELWQNLESNITILQQRSPTHKNKNGLFAQKLTDWIKTRRI
eukprot:TRINITY_DN1553_c0_g1_i1.p1 TRINITY_DN1553_c0_g1~~TRINITY_DN1553_c0_g1_i1.p1  ORF type:complete len:137 (-),score=22.48 TRINITY_DN1553_c0_g1_i1:444-809(-)